MEWNSVLLARSDLIVREEGDEGEVLLFDPETERLKVLNHTGFLLWQWCDGRHTLEDLVGMMCARYGATAQDVLRSDVESFLQQMFELGLLEHVGSP
jgi:Coenzyme PQQ synthesis protein D (PqqD)